ncbi:MAG: hypothetical protein HY720_10680, partial [Planctomycetes bacterium]|nr:hypothetical protein [Planctomycetota bacterium]
FVLPLPIAGLLYFGPDRLFSRDISENYPQVTGNFEAQEHPTFEQYGAVYPDPWTFRHWRSEFDEKHVDAYNKYYGFTTKVVPWKDRMAIHALTVKSYLEKTAEVRVFGGPLVVFGMLLGAVLLVRIDRRLLAFLALTLVVTTVLNIVTLDARGEHRIAEIGFVFAFPLGVALAAAVSALSRAAGGGWKGALAGAALVLAFLAHPGSATRVAFSRIYSGAGQGDALIEYVEKTREKKIPPGEVVALGTGQQTLFPYNLYADVDAVAFGDGTVKRLLAEGELDRAFEEYGVKWTLGYEPELAREIEEATGAKSIAPRLPGGE